jgi:hypothetical protein
MSHFAKIENGIVVNVIVAEQNWVDKQPGQWVQTSYNTRAGQHLLGGTPLRKNYAGKGYTYDSFRDAFIPPKMYPSWHLDENTCMWEPPKKWPTWPAPNLAYSWNEEKLDWDYVEPPVISR